MESQSDEQCCADCSHHRCARDAAVLLSRRRSCSERQAARVDRHLHECQDVPRGARRRCERPWSCSLRAPPPCMPRSVVIPQSADSGAVSRPGVSTARFASACRRCGRDADAGRLLSQDASARFRSRDRALRRWPGDSVRQRDLLQSPHADGGPGVLREVPVDASDAAGAPCPQAQLRRGRGAGGCEPEAELPSEQRLSLPY